MQLFCVVAGLLGHAAALRPTGVSDILGVPSVDADATGSTGASGAPTKAAPGKACLPACYTFQHMDWSVKCGWAERCKGCDECTAPPSDEAKAAAKAGAAAAKATKAAPGKVCLPICHTFQHMDWSVKCGWAERCKGCDECTAPPSDAAKAAAKAGAAAAKADEDVFVGGPSDLGSGDIPTSAPTAAPTSALDLGSGEPSASGAAPEGECADGFSRAYAGANCAGGAGSAWEAEHGNTGCDCTDGVCQNCCREECNADDTHVCYWAPNPNPNPNANPNANPNPNANANPNPNPNPNPNQPSSASRGSSTGRVSSSFSPACASRPPPPPPPPPPPQPSPPSPPCLLPPPPVAMAAGSPC